MKGSPKLFWFFLIICIFIGIKELIIIPLRIEGIDFWKHYYVAEHLVKGESPYTGDLYLSFNYPQFVAWLNLPLLIFKNIKDAERAWDIANIILVIFSACVVIWGYRPAGQGVGTFIELSSGHSRLFLPWWLVAIFLTLFFSPSTDGLRPGNLSSWVLIFIVLAGWGIHRGKDTWTGVMIALSAMIKIMPIFLLIPYILTGKKKVIAGASITFGIYIIILFVTGSVGNEIYLVANVLPHLGVRWMEVSYSIPTVITRHLFHSVHENPQQMQFIFHLWSLLLFISYMATIWINRQIIKSKKGEIFIFIIGTLLIPVISPLLEYHHFNWSFAGLLLAFRLAREKLITGIPLAIIMAGYFWLSIAGRVADVFSFRGLSVLSFNAPVALILYTVFVMRLWNLNRLCRDAP